MKLMRVGVDLAKNVFQIHGVDRNEKCKLRRKNIPLKRPDSPVAAVQKCTAGKAPIWKLREATGLEGGCTRWRFTTRFDVHTLSME